MPNLANLCEYFLQRINNKPQKKINLYCLSKYIDQFFYSFKFILI